MFLTLMRRWTAELDTELENVMWSDKDEEKHYTDADRYKPLEYQGEQVHYQNAVKNLDKNSDINWEDQLTI